jgi:hypothetical protein
VLKTCASVLVLTPSARECQICGHGISVVWRCVNRIYLVSHIGLKSCGRLPVKLHEVKLIPVAGGIELLNRVLKLIWSESQPFCELRDGVCLLMLLVGGVIDPTGPELIP